MLVDGQGRPQRRLQTDSAGAAFDDPNDAAADDRGGVYFSDPGVFDADAPATGEVFRLDAQGGVRRVAAGLRYPNGVFFDAARQRLLVSEHLARRVLAYPVLADGTLGEGQVLAVMPPPAKQAAYREAGPDGLEIGPDGALYVALYGEGRVLRLSPEGRLMGEIATPFAFVTNVAFDAASGRGVVVGAYVNDRAPFPGAVAALPELK
jgi:gluconolactonase